jgi:hypothetical protein
MQPPAAYDPKIRYVDFDAAYDGPVVDSGEENVPGVYMEKIVVCELCVKNSAELLGLENVEEVQDQAESWRGYAQHIEEEIAEKDKAIGHLAYTVGVLLDTPVKRPKGRPQLRGPESHEDEIKQMRSQQAKKERAKASNGANGN